MSTLLSELKAGGLPAPLGGGRFDAKPGCRSRHALRSDRLTPFHHHREIRELKFGNSWSRVLGEKTAGGIISMDRINCGRNRAAVRGWKLDSGRVHLP